MNLVEQLGRLAAREKIKQASIADKALIKAAEGRGWGSLGSALEALANSRVGKFFGGGKPPMQSAVNPYIKSDGLVMPQDMGTASLPRRNPHLPTVAEGTDPFLNATFEQHQRAMAWEVANGYPSRYRGMSASDIPKKYRRLQENPRPYTETGELNRFDSEGNPFEPYNSGSPGLQATTGVPSKRKPTLRDVMRPLEQPHRPDKRPPHWSRDPKTSGPPQRLGGD